MTEDLLPLMRAALFSDLDEQLRGIFEAHRKIAELAELAQDDRRARVEPYRLRIISDGGSLDD